MYALVDCNSFFCSVEKAFHPGLEGKPVCVLSSNDGCIVALTPEAKAVGLHRGDPLFKVKHIVERNKVAIFSSNMTLYAAMSSRIVNILRESIDIVEQYSIDECFCNLQGYEKYFDIEQYMRDVADKIRTSTGVPVSVGIAPTKTLAKIGSKFAKKYAGYRSVCMIDTEEKRRKALSMTDVADVWGVGRQTFNKLHHYGIDTALDFADRTEGWARTNFTLPTVRTWRELNGTPCIDTREIAQKQSICTSRSFGEMVTDLSSLLSSVANFASSCANKLRGQNSVAGSITVFISSNRFRDDLPQYANSKTAVFPNRTSDTIEINKMAAKLVKEIFLEGIHYKKSGVILGDIKDASKQQLDLFDEVKNRPARMQLMKAIDAINCKYGPNAIGLAAAGVNEEQAWQSKSTYRSGNYMTDINDLLTIDMDKVYDQDDDLIKSE